MMKISYLPIDQILPYENNAKIHTDEQIEKIKASIQQFGMNDPIAIWKNNQIIEGHGRFEACKELGFDTVPVIRLDDLSDEQRRAYMLVHNKMACATGFDYRQLFEELDSITEINMNVFDVGEDFEIEGLFEFPEQQTEGKKTKTVKCPYCGEAFEI